MVDYADNAWAFRGADGHDRSHIPAQPLWTVGLRLGQLLVGFIVFVLTAYAAGQLGSGAAGFGLTWFTYIWTLGYFAYLVVSLLFVPTIYNYWAHLGLEALTVIWWLCSWAVLASHASALRDFGFYSRFLPKQYGTAVACVKASAGLGALVWLLFLATAAFLVLSILNHRKAGGGMAPGSSAPMATVPPGGPVGGPVGQVPPQQPAYPQQAYQQPYQQPTPEGYPTPPPQQQYPMQQQQQSYAGGADPQYAPPQEVPAQQAAPYQQQQQQQAPYPQ